jgi:hypothetical protein
MLVCDWYWIYGGRAPTAAEFKSAVANKHIADGTLIDQLSALLDTFRLNPTPTNAIEPRGLALTKIYPLFPEYPLVDKVVRWVDSSGEHIVRLADDPTQPPVEVLSWFENPPVLGTNGLQLVLRGKAGTTNRVEYTTNLVSWWPVGEVVLTDGRAEMLDSAVPGSGQRYYRAVGR